MQNSSFCSLSLTIFNNVILFTVRSVSSLDKWQTSKDSTDSEYQTPNIVSVISTSQQRPPPHLEPLEQQNMGINRISKVNKISPKHTQHFREDWWNESRYLGCTYQERGTRCGPNLSKVSRRSIFIIPNYNQQDATFLDLFISTDALHVSGGSSAHHQEHITVHTASGIVNQYCC